MNGDTSGFPLNQAVQPPLEDLELLKAHVCLVSPIANWSDVGILTDDENKATLVLLLANDEVVAMLRFCLSVEDSISAIDVLRPSSGKIFYGTWQGHTLTKDTICSLDTIKKVWKNIPDQITEMSTNDVRDYFQRIQDGSLQKGRNARFSTATKQAVMLASHGRCMFEGCGKNIKLDQLTGTEGNFAYLAHNVASSESGPAWCCRFIGQVVR